MGLLERALAGLGKGLADSGEMNLKAQIEELRMNRLAELQEARDSRKYERERTDKLSDFERQKEWELEKMDAEYAHKAKLKGISVGGRGGGGGGGSGSGDPEDNFLRDDEGNVVKDPYTGEPVERSPGGTSRSGGRRGSSRSGKSSSSGGDAASMYQGQTDPETGVEMSCNKRTGDCRPFTITTPGKEYKPDTFGIADEQNLKQQNEAAQIEAALRDKKPVSTAPGYRSDDTVRALKTDKANEDENKEREYRLKELEAYDRSKKAHDESQENLPRSKRAPFMSEEDFRKRLTGGGGLIGSAMPEPKVEEPKPKVEDVAEKVSERRGPETPRVEEPKVRAPTPSRSEQGQRARPAGIPTKRAFHPKTGQWMVLINGKWYPE